MGWNCPPKLPVQVVKNQVCFTVDGGSEIKGWQEDVYAVDDAGIVSVSTLFYDRNDILRAAPFDPNSSTIELTSCCECDCVDCPLSSAPGVTPVCAVLRLDATPGGLSAATMNQFTLELLDGPQGAGHPCYPNPTMPFTGSPVVITSNGGSTISNFADVVNSELGPFGFQAAYCSSDRIAIQGPAGAGGWSIKISAPGNGDHFELIWDDVNGEFSEIEYANGVEVTVQPGDTTMANGQHPANGCNNCDPFV